MPKEKIVKRRALLEHVSVVETRSFKWVEVNTYKGLPAGTSICTEVETPHGISHQYDTHRPPRRRDESPVAYYRRTKCVDDHYTHRHNGWYYCNPAHCGLRWRDKGRRDEHLKGAYAMLD